MPRTLYNALTEPKIAAAVRAHDGRLHRLVDGRGLRLVLLPSGRRRWELRHQPAGGREVTIDLGDHPAVTLHKARLLAEEARVTARVQGRPLARPETFAAGLTRYVEARRASGEWTSEYAADVLRRLQVNAVPVLGDMLMGEIARRHVVRVVEPIRDRGALVQARRVRGLLHDLFSWFVARDEIDANPADDSLLKLLPRPKTETHHAAPAYTAAPDIYRALVNYPSPVMSCALRWTVLTAARTQETRLATFDEVDPAARVWRLSAERMKMSRPHVVPLSDEAMRVYAEALRLRRRDSELMFPTPHASKPLSANALLYALQRTLGFDFTTHGLARSTFSTWAHETRAGEHDAIEACLAHFNKDRVAAAYDRGTRLEERRAIMQRWAEFLSPAGPSSQR